MPRIAGSGPLDERAALLNGRSRLLAVEIGYKREP